MKEVKGNLITLALEGNFDVIAHGCNCFNTQKSGIAKSMVEAFQTDEFEMEQRKYWGDVNKLGQIDFVAKQLDGNSESLIHVVNCYTQYEYKRNQRDKTVYLDYEALALCFKKINHTFGGQRIGLPKIGCGLANGDWSEVQHLIKTLLKDCDVTIVDLK